ncbi:uncharacterized protein BJ171DRAFT_565472 [Polychytrium aggregatum]|uniref:uncharacterized protein n=1 Tax=Polychytrium aggregatum TaxID=110093 RepID=UPI0022FEE44E|nr:uncharacterized protein BJ171DRAFT_565472 [Polychytrium aggregatum]KAI9208351.1 hypothetical protein BJ171DRAFT_565472 [Polychytrium aggregatum]
MAESTLVQEDLARFDLLTILITNDAFIRAASPPLLGKLLRVSKQTRAILNTYQIWERLLFPKLQITPEFLFEGVDPSIDRLKVAQGLFYYALRQNQHKPTNSSMLEKENEFWSEVYRDEQLFNRVQRFCQVTDPEFRFPEDARPNSSKQPSVEEMITIAESQNFRSQWPIVVEGWDITIRPSARRGGNTYVSRLLPFDIPAINQAREKKLTLEDVSFLEVSGWPIWLSNISNLNIGHSYWGGVTDPLISLEGMPKELPRLTGLDLSGCTELKSLKGMPEMPKLETLQLPKTIESLEGMPNELPSLTKVNLNPYSRLMSLAGLSNVPRLLELDIPVSIETLVDVPEEFPSLTKLTISSRKPHNILSQLPSTPKLNHLILPSQFVSLADLRVNQSSLKVLDLHACCELKSLGDISSYPKLEILITSWRISGLPKGCRVVFNDTFEYTFGRFSSWLGMELLNILCFLYLALLLCVIFTMEDSSGVALCGCPALRLPNPKRVRVPHNL